jgi:hypothetical protein
MERFELELGVLNEDIELLLHGHGVLGRNDFFLNPRRLRGSDFLMRRSQGVWAEKRLVRALERTGKFFAVAYGPSGTAPDTDVREYELYFERLEKAGLGTTKRPRPIGFFR